MTNKIWSDLLDADQLIRKLPLEQTPANERVLLQIKFIRGFELFNTRPYHNYENWGDGYIVEAFDDEGNSIAVCRREDLDEALSVIKQLFEGCRREIEYWSLRLRDAIKICYNTL